MNNKISSLLAERRIINFNIIKLVKEDIKSLPYKIGDKCINTKTKEVFWIHEIRPTLLNGFWPNGDFTITVNPPKKDGTRSARKRILYYEFQDIKKLED
nr:MAG TPA: hypothetical protein [Caudoviricetes sp.]